MACRSCAYRRSAAFAASAASAADGRTVQGLVAAWIRWQDVCAASAREAPSAPARADSEDASTPTTTGFADTGPPGLSLPETWVAGGEGSVRKTCMAVPALPRSQPRRLIASGL